MARKVAVAVGVGKSGDLVLLEGARNGARDFATWAGQNGYDVVELIDDPPNEVIGKQIFDAVHAAAKAGDVERLVVFFAGHGVSKGTAIDFWLLSSGPENPNEAVNVDLSLRNARQCGVPHVVVFADACRTAAGKDRNGLGGMTMFPDLGNTAVDVEVDRFLAARAGYAAQEVVPDDEAEEAFGIFTACVMGALGGTIPQAAEAVRSNGDVELAVTAQSLKNYLPTAVEAETEKRPKAALQQPDCIPTSTPPRNVFVRLAGGGSAHVDIQVARRSRRGPRPDLRVLTSDDGRSWATAAEDNGRVQLDLDIGSWFDVECLVDGTVVPSDFGGIRQVVGDEKVRLKAVEPSRGAAELAEGEDRLRIDVIDAAGMRYARAPSTGPQRIRVEDLVSGRSIEYVETLAADTAPEPRLPATDRAVEGLLASLETAPMRDHFETQNGITLSGAIPVIGVTNRGPADMFEEGGAYHVRGDPDQQSSLLIQLDDGRWVAAALIPQFLGRIVVGQKGVDSVSYVAAPGSMYDEGSDPTHLIKAINLATAAIHGGRFEVMNEDAAAVAGQLRMHKHANPTLGVFAAYAYDTIGRVDQVRDMLDWFDGVGQTVPYDVAMLAGALDHPRIAPSFPLLTQGWAYLREQDAHPAIWTARDTLAPALGATPTGAGGAALADAIARGEIP